MLRILARAVKDRKAGILVGENFWKGYGAKSLSLGALGGVKLTTAYIPLPMVNINKAGIIPDVVIETDKTNPTKDFIPLNNQRTLSYGNIDLDVLGIQQGEILEFVNTADGVFVGLCKLSRITETSRHACDR